MKKICVIVMSLVMMLIMTTSAFAVISPSGETNFTVKHYVVSMITGDTSYQWYKVVPEGDTLKLTVDEKYIGKFVKWDIKGEYDIVSGELTDEEIVIRPTTDVEVYLYVNAEVEGPSNGSPESPDTSSNAFGVIAVMVLALGTAVVAKRELSK